MTGAASDIDPQIVTVLNAALAEGRWGAALDALPDVRRIIRLAAAGAHEYRLIAVQATSTHYAPPDVSRPDDQAAIRAALTAALPRIHTPGGQLLRPPLVSYSGSTLLYAHRALKPSAPGHFPVITADIGCGSWGETVALLSPIDPDWLEAE